MSDMPSASVASTASSPTDSTGNMNMAATKLCHIIKRPDFDGYGFNLHSEKSKPGQFIGKVDANSPAEEAGLKEGDRIMEVNGVAINSETHKQVVQRIKAISCEVRLLLIDVDGKGVPLPDTKVSCSSTTATNGMQVESKSEQILPGASENINSITMTSSKRTSQDSQRSSSSSTLNMSAAPNGGNGSIDVTDKAAAPMMMNNNNIPPPPSATMAKMSSNGNGNMAQMITEPPKIPLPPKISTMPTAAAATATTMSGNGTIKAGSLHLPMTAAEMRAKLAAKKKYDPKNESVDLKKKYEIVQKL